MAATNLSERADPFVGRGQELTALGEVFAAGHRLVTLVGAPGVGKTRLALEFGRGALAAGRWEEVWFCDLVESLTSLDLVNAVAETVEAHARGDDAPAILDELTAVLGERGRVLLILDNLEQMAATAGTAIAGLLESLPEVDVLVTSRERLGIAEEYGFSVGPLPAEDAVALYASRATRLRSDVEILPQDETDLEALVEQLDRLPLAIELAAARGHLLSPAQMVQRLGERFKLLRSNSPDRPKRHLGLRAALDWSWDLLNAYEQSALAQCSVFRGGFTLQAAEAVVELGDDDVAPWTLDVIASLQNRSLIAAERALAPHRPMRFRLALAVRDYADEKLTEETRRATEQRHAEFFLSKVEDWERQLDGSDERGVLEAARAERANVRIGFKRLKGDPASAGRVLVSVDRLLSSDATLREVIEVYQDHLPTLEASEQRDLLARALGRLGFQLAARGRVKDARPIVERARAMLDGLNDRLARFRVLLASGVFRGYVAEFDLGRAELGQALALARELEDRALTCQTLVFLGVLDLRAAEAGGADWELAYAAAEAHFDEAMAHYLEIGSARFQAGVLLYRSQLESFTGRFIEARRSAELALETSRQVVFPLLEGLALMRLGFLDILEMRYGEAFEHLEEAIAILFETGHQLDEATARALMGAWNADQGMVEDAIADLLEAYELTRVAEHPSIGSDITFWLGLAELVVGVPFSRLGDRFAESRQLAEAAHERFRAIRSTAAEATARALAGETERAEALWALIPSDVHLPARGGGDQLLVALHALAGLSDGSDSAAADTASRLVHRVEAEPAAYVPSVRMVVRAMRSHLDRTGRTADIPAVHHGLVVGPKTAWLDPPGKPRLNLSRRRVLRRLVERLVQGRRESPGTSLTTDELLEAGWPGQAFVGDSGTSRLYVAISNLRELGLSDVLLTRSGGYLLDPNVEMTDAPA